MQRLSNNVCLPLLRSRCASCQCVQLKPSSRLSHQFLRWNSDSAASLPKKPEAGRGKGPVTWKTLGITFAIGSILTLAMLNVKKEKELRIEKERTRSLGKASIGGPWDLVDHTGVARKSSDYHGQWVLIYFGFTHCPDVCPDELEKMCAAVDLIDADSSVPNIVPFFITVDAERDSVKAVADYVAEFSPKLIGLTGTAEQIGNAAKAFRVYYSQGPRDSENDYIMDHTIITYLIDPDGNFVDYYGQNKTDEEMSNSIKIHMTKFSQIHKSRR